LGKGEIHSRKRGEREWANVDECRGFRCGKGKAKELGLLEGVATVARGQTATSTEIERKKRQMKGREEKDKDDEKKGRAGYKRPITKGGELKQ